MAGPDRISPYVGLLPTPPVPDDLPRITFVNENAKLVFYKRYVRKGVDGKPVETPEQTFWRVAYHVAKAEAEFGASEEEVIQRARDFYMLLAERLFFPNSPTWTGAGTALGQLAACFVLKIKDDLGKDPEGIFSTLRNAALIQQTGGGNGFSFSRLRPKGTIVKSSAGKATGPVGFLRVYDKAFGEIAQGGCLLPDTLVFTERGLLRLDEIVDPARPGWQAHNLRVPTDDGWRRSPRGYNNGVAPVLRVHTREGLSLAGTPDHKVKVMTDQGPQWRELQDLQPGDWILVRLGQHQGHLQALRHPASHPADPTEPTLPEVLDEELAFFVGYFLGRGLMARDEDDHRVGVTVERDSYLMDEMPRLLEKLFGLPARGEPTPDGTSVAWVINSSRVQAFLHLNDLAPTNPITARVPRLIRQSPGRVVGAFLRGLFEAQGTLDQGYPVLTTPSRELAREVATLLIGLGVPVHLRPRTGHTNQAAPQAVYEVRIVAREGLEAWLQHVGPDPRSRLAVAYAWPAGAPRPASYVLPHPRYWLAPLLEAVAAPQTAPRGQGAAAGASDEHPALRAIRGEEPLTLAAWKALRGQYPEAMAHAPNPEGFWFVRVDRVEPIGEHLTLDLEVDENHTYLAYGLVTHNTRRGANMAVLRVDHPDIEEFITCKTDENAITNFNISVAVTDAFMKAVENDEEWELVFPDVLAPEYEGFDGTLEDAREQGIPIKVYKRMRARELFDKIVRQAHHNGEPGLLFLDTANRANPVPHQYRLEATNPCGEQWLGPYENCCLGSINLAQHATPEGGVDWEKLRRTVERAVRFLDDVVQANRYVPAVPQLKEAAHRNRRIGLGIKGLADLMYINRVRYGSPEAQEFAAQIMEFIRYHAMRTSIELARERGPFPGIKGSIYDPENLKWRPPEWPDWLGGGPKTDWGRPPINWDEIVEGIKKYGIRNAAQMTVAPTGCLVPGSMVVTEQGVLPIETLGNPRGTQWQDIEIRVASEGGPQVATKFYINGVAHTLRVRTRRGYIIQGTDGHRVRVWEDGEIRWKRLDELKPGMKVVLVGSGLVGKPRTVALDNQRVTDFHAHEATLPDKVTPELAYLVGVFMGDGSLKDRTLRFSLSDPRHIQRVRTLLEDLFHVPVKVHRDPRSTNLVSLEIHARNVVEFWRRNGFAKLAPSEDHRGKGYRPHWPLAILRTNDRSVYAAFLAGLFDADGSVLRYHITWTTVDETFHQQVKTVLLALGILTTTDYQTTGLGQTRAYRLRTAHAEAAARLWDLIEPYTYRERPTIKARRPSLRDTVPITEEERLAAMALAQPGDEAIRVAGWRQGSRASRASLRRFVEAHYDELDVMDLTHWADIVEQNLFFDDVADVTDGGWQPTYDLSVPGVHAYIAQGFISHNTISTVSGVEGYGCEPVFALAYYRYVNDEDGKRIRLRYVSPLFLKAIEEAGLDEKQKEDLIQHVLEYGTIQNYPGELPDWLRHTFVVSQDISAEEHVRMQAALQVFVDNAISKCVVGDTLVLTAEGLAPIATLGELRLPDQFAPLGKAIVSPAGVERAEEFYYGGWRETRKVTLRYGFTLEGTPNHRIHVLDADGRVVFRRLDELKPGDLVVLYAGQRRFGPPGRPLPRFSGTYRTNSRRLRFPERMSEELAFFLGAVLAEGAITINGVNISNTDRALLEQLQRLAQELFGLPGYIARDKRNQVHYLQLNSRALRHWLVADLGIEPGAANKTIPAVMLQASEDEIAAFLRGLFLDAYMTQDGRTFGITLASERLIRQLQVLLLNGGVLATARQHSERAWNLTVQGQELENLAAWLGFVETWKNERLARRNEGRVHLRRNYSRLLPEAVTEALREMMQQPGVSLRRGYAVETKAGQQAYQRARVNLRAGHRLTRRDARQIYETLRSQGARHPYAEAFFAHDHEHKVYVPVEKVEVGFAEVFDISVPGSHSFIANGMGNHNTINFPADATPDDVADAFMLAWKLGVKGLTVYVTGSRETVVLETKATAKKKEQKQDEATTPKAEEPAQAQATATAPSPQPAPEAPAQPEQPRLWPEPKKPRPEFLKGYTYQVNTPLGKAFVTINENGGDQPFEVFINTSKAGSETAAISEAIGRLISYILRLTSPIKPIERLREIHRQLRGIGGDRPLGFGPFRIRSLPDGVAYAIEKYLKMHEERAQDGTSSGDTAQPSLFTFQIQAPKPGAPTASPSASSSTTADAAEAEPESKPFIQYGHLCPECGQATLIYEEGCAKCYSCGYSEC